MRRPAREGSLRRGVAVAALICAAGVLCYLPLLAGGSSFVNFDDDFAIYQNPHIRSLDAAGLRWLLTDVTYWGSYVPLYWLGYALNYRFGGLDPFGYHAVSLALHLLNGLLLFQLLRLLLRAAPSGPGRREWDIDVIAGAATLFWLVHPLRVEPVAWAAARLYPQSVFFILVCLLGYVRAAGSAVPFLRSGWFWGALLAYGASLLTHQIGLTLVGVLVVLDVYPLRRLRPGSWQPWDGRAREAWLEKLPFLAVALAAAAVALWARSQSPANALPPPTLLDFPLQHRAMQAVYILTHYLWKPWWPLHHSPMYTTLISIDPAAPVFIASAVLLAAVAVAAFALRERWPAVPAALACHLILLVPVAGFFDHPHFPTDRYSYLQGLVWSAVAAAALASLHDRLRGRRRALALFAVPAALMAAAALSGRQVGVWADSDSLYRHILAGLGSHPIRAGVHLRLGSHYLSERRLADAVAEFDRTIGLVTAPDALHLRGLALIGMAEAAAADRRPAAESRGLFLDAADSLDRAAALQPAPEVLGAAGLAYAYAGQFAPAEDRLARGLQLAPGDVRLLSGLGMVLHRQGRTAEALEQLELAIRGAPELAGRREQIVRSWGEAPPGPE